MPGRRRDTLRLALRSGLALIACATTLMAGAAMAAGPMIAPTVRGLPITDKVVALTFDDGPSPRFTPQVLDVLKQNGAHATFFVIGQEALRYQDIVKAEAKAGMEIGNHGMHHLLLKNRQPSEIEAEANESSDLIKTLTGKAPRLYRLPQGVGDATTRSELGRLGYVLVNWSVDTRDYIRQSPESLYQRAMKQMGPGRIIIYHDGGGNRQASVDSLKLLLPELKRQGYTVTTVSDLLKRAGFRRPTRPALDTAQASARTGPAA